MRMLKTFQVGVMDRGEFRNFAEDGAFPTKEAAEAHIRENGYRDVVAVVQLVSEYSLTNWQARGFEVLPVADED